jgi:predicted nucleic acid-binding protein
VIVVSDTSPINYLVQMGLVDLLEEFYGIVYLPEMVASELSHRSAPETVRGWIQNRPRWAVVLPVKSASSDDLEALDAGERDAITLAIELHADTLLADDRRARLTASRLGFRVSGTLSLLFDAADAGKIDFNQEVEQLLKLGFRASRESIEDVRLRRR